MRGGMRSTSSTMYRFKKERSYRCDWCSSLFISNQVRSKFCCPAHKLKAFRIKKRRKSLSPLDRKGKHFRTFHLLRNRPQ